MASGPITSWQIEGKKWKQGQIFCSWAPQSLQMVTAVMKLEDACFLAITNLDSGLKGKDTTLLTKPTSHGPSSTHV